MDIEQLKLIISAVQGMTAEARPIFVLMIIRDVLTYAVVWGLICGTILTCMFAILRYVRWSETEEYKKSDKKASLRESISSAWANDHITHDQYKALLETVGKK